MNLVDTAQIVSALATAAALIFVTLQTKHARQAVLEAQRMHELEANRERRAMDTDAQRQAAQVVAWPVQAVVKGKNEWGLLIMNSSAEPVFGLSICREAGVSGKGKPIKALQAKAEVLPPGEYFLSDRSYWPELMGEDDTSKPIAGNMDFMAALAFRDSSGRTWQRDRSGMLTGAAA